MITLREWHSIFNYQCFKLLLYWFPKVNNDYNSIAHLYKWKFVFWQKRKKENWQLNSLGMVWFIWWKSYPSGEEWHGCHSKNQLFFCISYSPSLPKYCQSCYYWDSTLRPSTAWYVASYFPKHIYANPVIFWVPVTGVRWKWSSDLKVFFWVFKRGLILFFLK